jgi:hypothetical protein
VRALWRKSACACWCSTDRRLVGACVSVCVCVRECVHECVRAYVRACACASGRGRACAYAMCVCAPEASHFPPGLRTHRTTECPTRRTNATAARQYSQGLHTRREIKKGNLSKYEDGERDAKIAERKKRIANGTATAEDKAADKEYCAPTVGRGRPPGLYLSAHSPTVALADAMGDGRLLQRCPGACYPGSAPAAECSRNRSVQCESCSTPGKATVCLQCALRTNALLLGPK